MTDGPKLKATISIPEHFQIHEVNPRRPAAPVGLLGVGVPQGAPPVPPVVVAPPLGPLAAFTGNWHGKGFNTIFRPNNPATPTQLPAGPVLGDNVLELNLTEETLSFSAALGSVPNRGADQGDVFLNGVPYLQAINDVTDPAHPTGIHLEPGIWILVPSTAHPAEPSTVARMASIPHGTTVNAQGTFFTSAGPPQIAPVSITPFPIGGGAPIPFPSQTATNVGTPRIPQALPPTITQPMITDPNSGRVKVVVA